MVREIWQLGLTRNRNATILEHEEIAVVITGPAETVQIWRGDEEIIVLSRYHTHS